MWERRPGDADFGHVRVGLGAQCLSTPLVTPELGPVEELDPVTSMELRRLIRHRSMVPESTRSARTQGDRRDHSAAVTHAAAREPASGGDMPVGGDAQPQRSAHRGCRRSAHRS